LLHRRIGRVDRDASQHRLAAAGGPVLARAETVR